MEYHFCNIAIGGDVGNVIAKDYISSAELVLLKNIHGESSVFNIKKTGKYSHSDDEERDRLGAHYGDHQVADFFGKYGKFPKTLEETRINESYFDPVWKESLKNTKSTKKTTKKRARNSDGHFIGDDPNTPENEAFVQKEA